jgi:hypothetical protein
MAERIKPMPEIGFKPETLGRTITAHRGGVRIPDSGCAFEPLVVHGTGTDALIKGVRLANIEGFDVPLQSRPAKGGRPPPGV